MKRITTSIVLALGFVCFASAQTQSISSSLQIDNAADSIFLSESEVGDYVVRRVLVKQLTADNNEFSVRYQVNLTRLISEYDNNAAELIGLHSFLNSVKMDSLKKITAVNIIGYASPDGPVALNEQLSMERASDFREYIDGHCDMSSYQGTVEGVALPWSATVDAVESSQIPSKAKVLELVQSNQAPMTIQGKLKGIPGVWSYLAKNILPPMRCVEIEVRYNAWREVEIQTIIMPAAPVVNESSRVEREMKRECRQEQENDDEMMGIIFVTPDRPFDYDEQTDVKVKESRRGIKVKERERRVAPRW